MLVCGWLRDGNPRWPMDSYQVPITETFGRACCLSYFIVSHSQFFSQNRALLWGHKPSEKTVTLPPIGRCQVPPSEHQDIAILFFSGKNSGFQRERPFVMRLIMLDNYIILQSILLLSLVLLIVILGILENGHTRRWQGKLNLADHRGWKILWLLFFFPFFSFFRHGFQSVREKKKVELIALRLWVCGPRFHPIVWFSSGRASPM